MIRKVKYLVLLVFAVMLTTSCNKWLELKPQDGIIRQNFWKTKEDVKAAVVGCYSSLLGNMSQTLFLWGELRGDMVSSTLKTSADQLNIMNDNITSANSICGWSLIYQTINYCNTVITFAPNVLTTDPTFTQAALNGYLGEAYAIRGLMYFYLMRTFGDVPLKLNATSSDSQLVQLGKSPQADVYKQIVSDLTFAEDNAVITYGDPIQDKGRFNKYGINALQADVYLWGEDYANCLVACNNVIDSKKYGLIAGKNADGNYNSQWFNTLYYNGNSNESIFEFQFGIQQQNPFYSMIVATTSQQFLASALVMDQMYTIDPVDATNRDVRADMGNVRASDGLIWKYAGASGSDAKAIRTSTSSWAHWFVYRYADILLMKAEALAWTNNGQGALDLVKTIRDRANALKATEMNPDPTSAVEVCDYIMAERAREFAFEGKRWYDILRNSKRNNYAHLDYMLNIISSVAPATSQLSMISKYKDIRSHYLPINLYDIQTDPMIIQNPFYQ